MLASLSPQALLVVAGVFELRDTCCAALLDADNGTTITQLELVNSSHVANAFLLTKVALLGVANTTVCGQWTDDDVRFACQQAGFDNGFVVRSFLGDEGSGWPIAAEKLPNNSVVASSCTAKRNNCTHLDDVGALCTPVDVAASIELGNVSSSGPSVVNASHFTAVTNLTLEELRRVLAQFVPSSVGRVRAVDVGVANVTFAVTTRCPADNRRLPPRSALEAMLLRINPFVLAEEGVAELVVSGSSSASECHTSTRSRSISPAQYDTGDAAPSGTSALSPAAIAVVAVVVAVAIGAVLVCVVAVRRCGSGSASAVEKFAQDGRMNTLFVPLNLDDLESSSGTSAVELHQI